MTKVMHEKGIDMGFRTPQTIETAIARCTPDFVVTMDRKERSPEISGAQIVDWDLPDPAGESLDFMRDVRDDIEKRVQRLIREIT
jgi:protein-tyrosine-phosphatase